VDPTFTGTEPGYSEDDVPTSSSRQRPRRSATAVAHLDDPSAEEEAAVSETSDGAAAAAAQEEAEEEAEEETEEEVAVAVEAALAAHEAAPPELKSLAADIERCRSLIRLELAMTTSRDTKQVRQLSKLIQTATNAWKLNDTRNRYGHDLLWCGYEHCKTNRPELISAAKEHPLGHFVVKFFESQLSLCVKPFHQATNEGKEK
jgi:Na+-transporting methylmalonyl-CoA/oxaloacetate decarboxylase gamma subunit